MRNFFEQLKKNIQTLVEVNTKIVFTIATTSKKENLPYLTPIRKNACFTVFGCIIFEKSTVIEIIKIIDGAVDYVLVDSEKKIPFYINQDQRDLKGKKANISSNFKTEKLSNICSIKIKKSKIFEYKPSDITVNATWSFLSQKLNFLSGKKISILGSGNIGSKLALKLVECGVSVSIYRQNTDKGYLIAKALNFVKSKDTKSSITFHRNILDAALISDVLIGATNGIPIIDLDLLKGIKKDAIIVDLGKNTLTKEAIQFANTNNIEIYRTDITSALEGFIFETIKMNDILNESYGKKDLGYCAIVGGGYFGIFGDIIVDNVTCPSRVLGVAAGDGTMKKRLSKEDKDKLIILNREILSKV